MPYPAMVGLDSQDPVAHQTSKPLPWDLQPGLTQRPDLWAGMQIFVPFWEYGSTPTEWWSGMKAATSTGLLWTRREMGPMYHMGSLTTALSFTDAPRRPHPTTELTVMCRNIYTGTTDGANSPMIAKGNNTVEDYSILQSAALTGRWFGKLQISGVMQSTAIASAAVSQADPFTWFLRWRSGEVINLRGYSSSLDRRHLVHDLSSAVQSGVVSLTTNPLFISCGSTGLNAGHIWDMVAVWTRKLSDAEIQLLNMDPWLLVRPAVPLHKLMRGPAGGTIFPVSLSASLTPAGALAKQVNMAESNTVTATGVLTKEAEKAFAAAVSAGGVLIRRPQKALSASSTPAGSLTVGKVAVKAFTASLTPAGALLRSVGKALAGSSTPTATITRRPGKALTASSTPAGNLTKRPARTFAASITATGSVVLNAVIKRTFTATMKPIRTAGPLLSPVVLYDWEVATSGWVGESTAVVTRVVSPVISGVGSLRCRDTLGAGAANVRFNNAGQTPDDLSGNGPVLECLIRITAGQAGNNFSAHLEVQDPNFNWIATNDVNLTPGVTHLLRWAVPVDLLANNRALGVQVNVSDVNGLFTVYIDDMQQGVASGIWKQVGKSLGASSTAAASLSKRPGKLLSGSSAASTVLTTFKSKAVQLTASLTPSGTLSKRVGKSVSASTSPVGALAKQLSRTFTASSTPSAVVSMTKVALRSFTASLSATANLIRRVDKALAGSSTPTGSVSKRVNRSFTASTVASAVLQRLRTVPRSFSATISSTATLRKRVDRLFGASVAGQATTTKQVRKSFAGSVAPSGVVDVFQFGAIALKARLLWFAGRTRAALHRRFGATLDPTDETIATPAAQVASFGRRWSVTSFRRGS